MRGRLRRRTPSTGPVRVALATIGVLAALLGSIAGASAGAAGAQAPDQSGEPTLRLVQQTPWVGPDGTFQIAVAATGLPEGSTVQGELHSRVRSRAALAGALDDDQVGSTLYFTTGTEPGELQPAQNGTIVVTVPLAATPVGRTAGVYPFVLKVYDPENDLIASLTTAMLRLGPTDQGATSRLAVGVVVPLDASVTAGDDGRPTMDDASATHLVRTAAAVAGRPDVPLTLLPSAESLELLRAREDWSDDSIAGLRTRVARQVLAGPYAPVDSGAWLDSGLDAELTAQHDAGSRSLDAIFGGRPDPTSTVTDPTVSPAALAWLQGRGTTTAVVPSGQLEPLSDRTQNDTFARLFDLPVGDTGVMRGAVGDDRTAARLGVTDDPVLSANRALAELAMLQLVQTQSAGGVAVVVPAGTDPTALSTFLAGLADAGGASSGSAGSPLVSAVTLTDLFVGTDVATVTRAGRPTTLTRGYRADPPADLGSYPSSLRASGAQLAGLRSLVPTSPEVVEPVAATILSSGSRTLDAVGRQAMLDAAGDDVTAVTSEIVVSPEQVVTLTSSSGRVPLNLENRLSVPATVRIVMSSAKLDFPEGDVIESEVLAPAQTTTIELPVETRASGAFPLTVTITSADGTLPVATTTYTVRSTAISGVGLVLSIGAGLFLLVWWARHFRTARRARKLVASTHPALSGTGPDGYAPADTEPPAPDAGPPELDTDPLEDR